MCIFTGEEWWCLKVHVAHLETLYTRLKSFFKADLSTNTTHLHDGVTLILRILFVFPFMFFFFNLVIPGRSKALICTRKRNPEDSGRSSKMASSCQWPFYFFLLASLLLNSNTKIKHLDDRAKMAFGLVFYSRF